MEIFPYPSLHFSSRNFVFILTFITSACFVSIRFHTALSCFYFFKLLFWFRSDQFKLRGYFQFFSKSPKVRVTSVYIVRVAMVCIQKAYHYQRGAKTCALPRNLITVHWQIRASLPLSSLSPTQRVPIQACEHSQTLILFSPPSPSSCQYDQCFRLIFPAHLLSLPVSLTNRIHVILYTHRAINHQAKDDPSSSQSIKRTFGHLHQIKKDEKITNCFKQRTN